MGATNYYLLTVLPGLPEPGAAPPLSKAALRGMVAEADGPLVVVDTILLSDDLRLRDAVLAGEVDPAAGAEDPRLEPAVLTGDQLRDDAPLPPYLAHAGESRQPAATRPAAVDVVWEAYFRHAAVMARQTGNAFLSEWVGWEIGLRNALARERAKALELDPQNYLVAPELAADEDYTASLNAWSTASDPLAALRALDRRRWEWIDDHDAWFTFADDEVAAYTARIVLLHRWQRLETEKSE